MLGCGTLPSCGCHNTTSSDLSYSSESSSSDADMRRHQSGSCQDVVKHNGVGAFLAALSPRNLFRGFKKNSEFSMPKAERTMKAAILIQQWYRRYLARMEVRRRYTWTIFQSIEYQGEQDQVKLYNFFNALLTHIPTTPPSQKPITSDTTSKSSSTDTTVETKFEDESPSDGGSSPNQFVESNYKGIHLGNPLTRQDLDNLIESFRKKKSHRLHAKYVATILKQATAALKKLPNLNVASTAISKQSHRLHAKYVATILKQATAALKNLPNLNVASTAISKQVTVCGDLHGKLEDLLIIFHKSHRLHAKYVATILKQATAALKNLPNLNVASTAISKQVTVCGDLHGKLEDLLIIFHKNGLPSAENPYVFNGDFVDRGKKGLEVFLLLLAVLLVFPDGVFLNRGNHEDHVMNTRYGFIREVKLKYKHNAERLLKLIEGVYRWLPLGTLVNNKVLIVHGGISDITDLDWVRSLDRQKYVSLLRPPVVPETNDAVATEAIDKMEWKQVFDILWSDPQGTEGCVPNTLRGAGTYFGPDVTEKFLDKHNLLFIIRSHECKIDGYELTHNDKVVTIFSASNYYETGSNKGAYLKLVGPQLVPHFVQFNTAKSVAKALTFRQKVGLVESSAIRELSTKVQAHREKLIAAFRRADVHDSGLVTVSEWCAAMEDTTGLSLPWRMLKEKLVLVDPTGSGKVRYMTTFQDIEPAKRGHGATVVETLYRNKSSLEAIFRIIDKDNSGYISLEEFKDACELLGEHLQHPQDEALDICKSMDINKDGMVDLNEFLETFRLVDMEVGRGDSVEVDSDDEADRD